MLDPDIQADVFADVTEAVDKRVNALIDPDIKTTDDHEIGGLNFLRRAVVSDVQEENELLANYGPVQKDCDCAEGKRIDFQECVPVEGRDVSSNFQKNT